MLVHASLMCSAQESSIVASITLKRSTPIRSMPRYLFPNGIATASGACVVVQVVGDDGGAVPGSLYADYRFTQGARGFATEWTAISLCEGADGKVYAVGEDGEVLVISGDKAAEELIDPPDHGGPAVHGPIREVRAIDKDVYAVGMGRQIFNRRATGIWSHSDHQIIELSARTTVGFTSIAGDPSGFRVAVGYNGEIWELRDVWRKAESPTNLLLTRVVVHRHKYYAVGVAGYLMSREAVGWRTLDVQDNFDSDVWDVVSFLGILYLGTNDGLYQLADDERVSLVEGVSSTGQANCASLSAGYGRIWCFGADAVCSSPDGRTWRKEFIL